MQDFMNVEKHRTISLLEDIMGLNCLLFRGGQEELTSRRCVTVYWGDWVKDEIISSKETARKDMAVVDLALETTEEIIL